MPRSHTLFFSLLSLLMLSIVGTFPFQAFSQLSQGGIPLSIRYQLDKQKVPVINLEQADLIRLAREDADAGKNGLPYRYAIDLPCVISPANAGVWEELSNGDRMWRVTVTATGAIALAAVFDQFYLPEGTTLYLYDATGKQITGAFTSQNNQDNGLFATELIQGDTMTLEYVEPAYQHNKGRLRLSAVSYAYRGVSFHKPSNTRGFGSSGACEVNVNCPEGQNWQNQKRSVIRISVKIGGSSFWCTGTLVNNVLQDYKPYVLTADHCGAAATANDLSLWVFYFNYESLDCPDPTLEPGSKTLTGAKKKAASGGNGGQIKDSDLYLVILNNPVPDNYFPFYSGWNRQNATSPSGTGIHHPQGDIKKISTYTSQTFSSAWGSTPNTHWGVRWNATQHGHGVTEPGSSGSPLFNSQGQLTGQLSGGESSCANLNAPDLYGKFSFSWQPAASDSSNSLHYWLDPANTGADSIPGLEPNITYVIANFTANQDTFTVGTAINFTDLSSGNPTSWNWKFEGGTPETSMNQHPDNIMYNKTGVFPVTLVVSNNATSDTMEKKRYITVLPHIYPNPHNDFFTIDLGSQPSTDGLQVEVCDIIGRKVNFLIHEANPGTQYGVYILNPVNGMYYLKIKSSGLDLNKKIMFIKTP